MKFLEAVDNAKWARLKRQLEIATKALKRLQMHPQDSERMAQVAHEALKDMEEI